MDTLNYIVIFMLLSLTVFRVQAYVKVDCNNTVFVNNKYYTSENIKSLNGIPADMNIHWNNEYIYFTLISIETRMSLYVMKPNLDLEKINVDGLGQSSAVDNENNIVYVATDNGLYKFDEDTSRLQLYAGLGEDVMYLALSDQGRALYIATWPQNRVRKLTNDGKRSEPFSPIANGHGLTIDYQNNMYYEAVKTPYILKNGDALSIRINGFKKDKMVDFFLASSGDVFAMDEDSNFYKMDPKNATARYLGSFGLEGVNTFGIDGSNNIIVGVKNALIKWVAHDSSPCK